MNDVYSVKEVADKLRVSPRTIQRGIKDGRIKAFRVGEGKTAMYRITEIELQRMQDFDLREFKE